MPRYEFPISGHLIVEADDFQTAEKQLTLWVFETMRNNAQENFDLPDLFGSPARPQDIIIKVDHNHSMTFFDYIRERVIKEMATYQDKKLSSFLPKRKRDAVQAALRRFVQRNSD